MSKKLKIILTLACVAMTFIGVLLFFGLSNGDNLLEHTTITLKGETTKTLSAEIKDLYPGSVSEYEIILDGDHSEEFYITLSFREISNGKLKDYIGVKIKTDNVTIEKPLKELLDEKANLSLGQNSTNIKITYTMAIDAGNETQGADIKFYIDLTAKRVE